MIAKTPFVPPRAYEATEGGNLVWTIRGDTPVWEGAMPQAGRVHGEVRIQWVSVGATEEGSKSLRRSVRELGGDAAVVIASGMRDLGEVPLAEGVTVPMRSHDWKVLAVERIGQ